MVPDYLYQYKKYFIEDGPKKPNYTKSIIKNNQFYYPKRCDLNDLFECRFLLTDDTDVIKPAFYSGFVTIDERVEKEIYEKYGILSFTTKNDNITMFAHYANNHSGVCLTFDTQKDDIFKKAFPVNYRNSIPSFETASIKDTSQHREIFSTKSQNWSYEDEWRILYNQKANEKVFTENFNPEALAGIIFGYATSDEVKREIYNLISQKKHKVKVYQAAPKKSSYGLDIEEVTEDNVIDLARF